MGVQGHRADKSENIEYFARPLNNGDMALVVVNSADASTSIKVPWSEMRIAEGTKVRDLWKHEDFTASANQSFAIPAHGSLMFRMRAPK